MAILSAFWQDESAPDAIRAIQIEGWLDVLQELSEQELRDSWADYQRTGPRNAARTLKRPDPGALRDIAMRARDVAAIGRPKPPPEPERVISEEDKARRREFAQSLIERMGYSKAAVVPMNGERRKTVTDEDRAEMRAALARGMTA